MKIKNYPTVGSVPQSDVIIRKAYKAFRKNGSSPLHARLMLRALFTMGENVGLDRFWEKKGSL